MRPNFFYLLVSLTVMYQLASGQLIGCIGDMIQECYDKCPSPGISRCNITEERRVVCHCISPKITVDDPFMFYMKGYQESPNHLDERTDNDNI